MISEISKCQPEIDRDKNQIGKACTCCHQWRLASEYHQNKSKTDGLESHCKSCVSKRKERTRKARKRQQKKCNQFDAVISGSLSVDVIESFALLFGAAFKEIVDETNQTETH